MIRLPEGSAPKTHNITHTITAYAEIPQEGAEGVLVCLGGDTAGWSFYILAGKLVYHYNWFDVERYEVVSNMSVPSGKVELKCLFVNEGKMLGGPASVTLFINGQPVGTGQIEKQVRGRFSVETLDVGVDALTPVSKAYEHKRPFWFTGKIEKVRFDFGDSIELSAEEKMNIRLGLD
jgi:arylsulfatase